MDLVQELMRRNVVRVAAIYAMTAWLLVQIAVAIEAPLNLPNWFDTFVIVIFAIGFPVAMVLAWAFELTPEGVKPTKPAADGAVAASGQSPLNYVIAGLLLVTLGSIIYSVTTQNPSTPQEIAIDVATTSTVLHNSIAVLPFENLSPDPNDAYFAAGIHEETLNQLAKIKDLTIIARTTMMRYAQSEKSVPEIAADLNVGAVMEGSVRYAGDRVRITAQLIDATTGAHLWSETYDRELVDIFAIESDIALDITTAMKAEFEVAEQKSIATEATEDPQAFAHYVRALSIIQSTDPDTPSALAELDKAMAADPQFALPIATKAMFFAFASAGVGGSIEDQSKAFRIGAINNAAELAQRALSLDPNQAHAYVALSLVREWEQDWDGMIEMVEKAVDLHANLFSHGIYAERLGKVGRWAEAKQIMIDLLAIDPLNPGLPFYAALYAGGSQDWAYSKRALERGLAMTPDYGRAYVFRAYYHDQLDETESALSLIRKGEELARRRPITAKLLEDIISVYGKLGQKEDVDRLFQELKSREGTGVIDNYTWARAYAANGDLDQSFNWLQKMVDERDPAGELTSLAFRPDHPSFSQWQGDPRFDDIVEQIKALAK